MKGRSAKMKAMIDWKGKRVTIMGLGQFEHGSGLIAAMYAARAGADLIITDLKTAGDLAHQVKRFKDYLETIGYVGKVEWVMGEHRDQDFTGVDMIIRNPGVPIKSAYLQKARAAGVPVESEMTLFFRACPSRIIGITGTRGKSTTTALIAHILEAGEKKLWWGGNIGKRSPLEFVDQVKADDVVVLELSSWMLESVHEHALSPQVAVLLNVQEDHLNRYSGMAEYAEAKSYLIRHQKPEDVAIINHGNEYTSKMDALTKARVVWFDRNEAIEGGYRLKETVVLRRVDGKDVEVADLSRCRLLGKHNQENILAAVACAVEQGISRADIEAGLATFQPLPGRLQYVDQARGVTFVNDTTATTPSATLAALEALHGRPIILITGGADKGLHFDALGKAVPTQTKAAVFLPGTATQAYKDALSSTAGWTMLDAATMQDAVEKAFGLAETGDMIVLSPACASFGLFKNEFDRGAQFDAAVAVIAKRA